MTLTPSQMRTVSASIAQEQEALEFLVPALQIVNGGLTPEMRDLVMERAREASAEIVEAAHRRHEILGVRPMPSLVGPELRLESEK